MEAKDVKQFQVGLDDFTFLQELSELEVVCIINHKLDDVSVFSNLHRVEGCGLSALEGLAEFKALETLCVAENLFTEEQKKKYPDTSSGIEIDFEN